MIKNWILYAGLLGVFLYLQYFYGDPVSVVLVAALACVMPLALVYGFIASRSVRAFVSADRTAVDKGEPVTLRFTFQNAGILTIPRLRATYAVMGQDQKHSLSFRFSLGGQEERVLEHVASSAYCGSYESRILRVWTWDPFGLFGFRLKPKAAVSVLILPRMITLPPSPENAREETERPGAPESNERGNTSVAGIRDYAPGDPLRSIHWKLTAKSDATMVKEYDFLKRDRERFLIDFFDPGGQADPAVTDRLIELAVALAMRQLAEDMPADFAWYATDGALRDMPVDTREDFGLFFSAMASAGTVSRQECGTERLLNLLNGPLFSGGPVTLVTAARGGEAYAALSALAELREFPVRLIVAGAAPSGLDRLLKAGAALVVADGEDIAAAFANH